MGVEKVIRDSVKYCHADPRIGYISFLEDCRKAEYEGRASPNLKEKLRTAAATVTHDKNQNQLNISESIPKQHKSPSSCTKEGKNPSG